MKNFYKINSNKIFVGALCLLIALNIFGTVSENALFLQSTKPLFIPVFLIFFFIRNKVIILPFILFLLFSFLGDSASMFFSNETFLKASSIMYLLSYFCLVGFVAPKFNFEKINIVIALYLIFVILINMYFLYTIYSILKTIVPDSLEVFLFGVKSISMIFLVIIAFGIYLTSETKLSILFLIMAISFVFSDILNYVSHYYVYHWSLLALDRILHVVGLFFFFKYIMEYNKLPKRLNEVNDHHAYSKNILV